MVRAKTVCAGLTALMLLGVFTQAQYQSQKEKMDDALGGIQAKAPMIVTQPVGMALESTIDPGTYVVGPSDMIAVNIWMSPPVNFTLTVTPEGTLIVPTVGEIVVAGRTLAQAKERVLHEIRARYARAEATVTLVVPRPIVVNVMGQVLNPGLYTVTAADRASRVIEKANEVLPSQRGTMIPPAAEYVSTRNIVLRHRNGTADRVDIPLYVATKKEKLNPLLCEGDVVVVPERHPDRNVFGVYGEVNLPGRFELAAGDSLSTALQLAQGFGQQARTDSVLFSRLSADGTVQRTEVLDLRDALRGDVADRALEPGDRIVVPTRPDLRQDYRVYIDGEVKNPGMYPITKDRTRLSEAMRLAGGFTEFASLKTAQLIRRSISPNEVQMEILESIRGGISAEDSAYYQLETQLRVKKELVVVDFERLFAQHDTTQDVTLRSEDYVHVPSERFMVYVFGQVITNGYIPFVAGEGVQYYVKKAGGYTDRAREGDVRIVKARTRQWLAPNETSIEAGDYIWVPRVIDRSFGYYMAIVGQTAAIVSVALSIVLLTVQINK
jgi:polysaccharide export outer membrane protein